MLKFDLIFITYHRVKFLFRLQRYLLHIIYDIYKSIPGTSVNCETKKTVFNGLYINAKDFI